MIEVRNLTKTFPGIVALDDISFDVGKGEIVGFLGPNGAGKSTTMRILTCFIPPTTGACRVAGYDVIRGSMDVRRRVGYLPESNPLYTEMRVLEYLDFRASIKAVPRRERRKKVEEAMDRCGLRERRLQIVGTLSKGYRQRVGLADAIVHNPEVLILDEPTIGLDPTQVREVRELIKQLGQERTVLLSTHILSEVEKMCRRIVIINRGKIVAEGTPEEVSTRLMKTGRLRLEIRGDGRAMKDTLENVPGVARILWSAKGDVNTYIVESEDGVDIRGTVFKCCAAQSWDVLEFGPEQLSLEDVFAIVTQVDRAPEPQPAVKEEAKNG